MRLAVDWDCYNLIACECECVRGQKHSQKVKVITLLYHNVERHCSSAAIYNSPARNTPENSPNLGVSILSCVPPPHGDEIGGHPHTGALSPSSHTGLVPILHLGGVKCGLQKHCPFPPFTDFFGDWRWIACVAFLHANHYTKHRFWNMFVPINKNFS